MPKNYLLYSISFTVTYTINNTIINTVYLWQKQFFRICCFRWYGKFSRSNIFSTQIKIYNKEWFLTSGSTVSQVHSTPDTIRQALSSNNRTCYRKKDFKASVHTYVHEISPVLKCTAALLQRWDITLFSIVSDHKNPLWNSARHIAEKTMKYT